MTPVGADGGAVGLSACLYRNTVQSYMQVVYMITPYSGIGVASVFS